VLVLKTGEGGLWTLPHVEELRSRGAQVVVVLPRGDGRLRRALTQRQIPVVESGFDFRFRPRPSTVLGLCRLRWQLRALAPDVVHYHLYASALATRLATAGLRVARVHMVAGPLYLESSLIRAVERLLVRMDTITIAGSDFTAEAYRALGRPRSLTPVVPYGVDADHFRPVHPTARTRVQLGLGPDVFVAVMVAWVYAPKQRIHGTRGVKGHDVLLEAWRSFHAAHPAAHLLLVGAGFDEAGERHRQELIARYEVGSPGSGITWIGAVDDVRPYYAAADVSVSPSLSDNHGAALEAGAMGLARIVSDAGGLPETVDEHSGWTVPCDDPAALAAALVEAYAEHHDGRLAERGRRSRRLVAERFHSRIGARAVADLVEQAARRTGPGPGCAAEVSVFTEARLGRTDRGRWAAIEEANGAAAWSVYLRSGAVVRLVGRAQTQPGTASATLPAGVQVAPLPYYVGVPGLARSLPALVIGIRRAVRTADVAILRVPGPIGSVAALACRFSGRRYAVEVVGDPADVLASGVAGQIGRRLAPAAAAQMRWMVRGAAASRFVTRQTLQRRYPPRPGTPSVGVSDIRLEPSDYLPAARSWRPRAHIVAVGSQETRYKGHDLLLLAVARLAAEGLEARLTLVGGGRTHDELRSSAADLGVAERVTFTGMVHCRRRIQEILDDATLFAMPSRTEGLPRALLEAMARALPAVGSDVGGIPELLEPSCLVPVDDHAALARCMGRLLCDQNEWERQSARNLRMAREYEFGDLDARYRAWLARVPPARRPAR